MRILIIENDRDLGGVLKANFEKANFVVDWEKDYEKGAYSGRLNGYGAIIIDACFDRPGAEDACVRIRDKKKTVPLIIISSSSGIKKKVRFFDIGANDHLAKPFSFQELLARTKSILKRPNDFVSGENLEAGGICLNRKKHQAACHGKELVLSRKEFMLLELLMERKGEAVSRGEMLENVWEGDADPFSNTIETHITSIRRKIEKSGGGKPIRTISGVGYRMEK